MSSAEKERGLGKKGGALKVSESKKEKKRRLILSDSELDDEYVVCPGNKISNGADQNGGSFSEKKRERLERLKREEDAVEYDVKHREEVFADRKRILGPGSEKKRSREPADEEIPLKKIKTYSLKCRGHSVEGISGKKLKANPLKYGVLVRGDRVGGSKLAVPAGRERDGRNENKKQFLSKSGRLEAEKNRSLEHSDNQTLRMLKHKRRALAEDKIREAESSQSKSIRVKSKSGVLRILPSNKKVAGLEKVHTRMGDIGRTKRFGSSGFANEGKSKQPYFSGQGKVLGKSSPRVALGKDELKKGRISSSQKIRPLEKNTEPKLSSPQRKSEHVEMSNCKADLSVRGENSPGLKTRLLTQQDTNDGSVRRNTVKQQLRDQIKTMLLNAGWKIDLRPRRGRNYEDAVYVSPQGTGYWSITKAYDVFQEQLNCAHDDKSKGLSRKSSKVSSRSDHNPEETSSAVPAIPMEALSMLKRNVVNKRRRRIEVGGAQKKMDRGRRSKVKDITKMQDSKSKHSKDKFEAFKGSKRSGSTLGSLTKDVGGSASYRHLKMGRNKQRGCALLARGANQEEEDDADVYIPYVWKRTVFSWMIDLGVMPPNGKVKYMNKRRTQAKLEGRITRDGINCSCCSKILTVSKFELHAGSKLNEPYQNIFVEDVGVSLLQCQLNAWEKQDESERQGIYTVDTDGDDPNDDTCGICGDGGDLICCDGCPSTFHLSCLDIQMLPPGDWHCTNCLCRFCGGISGAAAQENGAHVSSLLSCSQCEGKYHQDCIPEADSIPASSNKLNSFCGKSCWKVFNRLQKLLGVRNDLESGFSWRLIRRFDEDSLKTPCGLPQRAECNSKIAVAFAVMDECFLPITDQRSGINLIHNVVYNCGSNFTRLNYSGFYTFILERGDEIISAASVRIHGTRLAEMPFIGTRNMYRRQGMCRRLLSGIESVLCSLNIEKLIIPAISELKDTWTTVFGFKPLEILQELEVRSVNMLVFPGTGLLQKPLLKHSADQSQTADAANKVEAGIKRRHQMLRVANESSVLSNIHASDTSTVFPDAYEREDKATECKPSEACADEDLHIHSREVHRNGLLSEVKTQNDISTVPKSKLCSESPVNESHVVKIVNTGTIVDHHDASDTLVGCTSEATSMSPDGIVSTFDSGARAAPDMPSLDGNSLSHTLGSHSEASDGDLYIHPEEGYHDEHVWEIKYKDDFSAKPKIEPGEGVVDEGYEVKILVSTTPNIHDVHESIENSSEEKHLSPEGIAYIFQDSGLKTAPNVHAAADDLLHHSSEAYSEASTDVKRAVHHDEPMEEVESQEDFSTETKAESPSENAVDRSHEGEIEDASAVAIPNDIDNSLVQGNSEVKCISPDGVMPSFLGSGEKTASDRHAIDNVLHTVKVHCPSPDVTASAPESGANHIQISVCSPKYSLNPTDHSRPEAPSKSISQCSEESNFQESSELILNGSHDAKDQSPIFGPELKPFGNYSGNCHPECFNGSVDHVVKDSIEIPLLINDGTVPKICDAKAEVAAVVPKPYASDEDSEQCASEVIDRTLNVAPVKETQFSCRSCRAHDY